MLIREAVRVLLTEFSEQNGPQNVLISLSNKLKPTRLLMVGHVMNSANRNVALCLGVFCC